MLVHVSMVTDLGNLYPFMEFPLLDLGSLTQT